jgi:two-component system sensor histidine kinase TctE
VKAGIDLGYEGEKQLMVQGNAVLLREALNNLIDNALTYAGKGSLLTVQVLPEGQGRVQLCVEDNGPGVEASDLPLIFQRFWRGNDKAEGCGLGLAVVREIALRHHGRVLAEKAQPSGLRVGMSLPRIDGPSTA